MGALVVLGAMLLTLPLVGWQGPASTTPMDAVNILFIVCYWPVIVARRETVSLPLLRPFLLIMLGSAMGMWAAYDRDFAALTVLQEVYLYVWFVTVAHFLTRYAPLDRVVVLWAVVASTVALLTLADAHYGLLGGRLAGDQRALGTFENPNMYGSYLVISFFLAWAAAQTGRRWLYLTLPLLFVGVRATASNGALLGFLGGCGAAVIAMPAARRPALLGPAFLAGALGVAALGIWREPIMHRAQETFSQERGAVGGAALKGFGERLPLWLDALDQIQRAPTGVGAGNFNRRGGKYSRTALSAHNEYLGMLTERGPFGLLGWCAVLVGVFAMLRQLARFAAVGIPTLGVVPLYGFFGAMVAHAFVIELSHFRHVWLAFALIVASVGQAGLLDAAASEAELEEAA